MCEIDVAMNKAFCNVCHDNSGNMKQLRSLRKRLRDVFDRALNIARFNRRRGITHTFSRRRALRLIHLKFGLRGKDNI